MRLFFIRARFSLSIHNVNRPSNLVMTMWTHLIRIHFPVCVVTQGMPDLYKMELTIKDSIGPFFVQISNKEEFCQYSIL